MGNRSKKEVAPGFMWHLEEIVVLYQVAIVTTMDPEGRVNAAPFGLILPFCSSAENPQMLLCSNSVWHTSQNIEATGEFVINYAPYRLMKQVAETARLFAEGVNEIEKAGLTGLPSLRVKPPRIQECFQHIECRLNRIIRPAELQNNFIGDVLAVSLDAQLVDKTRDEKLKDADPLLLYGVEITRIQGNYAGAGKTAVYAPPNSGTDG